MGTANGLVGGGFVLFRSRFFGIPLGGFDRANEGFVITFVTVVRELIHAC